MSDPHQGPNYFCMNLFNEFHYLEPWSLFMLIKKKKTRKSRKIIWKQWKCILERKLAAKSLLKFGSYCLRKVWGWFFKVKIIWMKTNLKAQFKAYKIMRWTRSVQKEEESVRQNGCLGVQPGDAIVTCIAGGCHCY